MNPLRRLFCRPRGGIITPSRMTEGAVPVLLSPGRRITDPDEAEALGMTVDARRLREQPIRPEAVCLVKGCGGPTHEPRNWVGYLLARYHWH